MRRRIFSLLLIISICSLAFSFTNIFNAKAQLNVYPFAIVKSSSKIDEKFFTENKGQWNSSIYFMSEISFGRITLKQNSVNYELFMAEELKPKERVNFFNSKSRIPHRNTIKSNSIKLTYLDSNIVYPQGMDPVLTYYNYFLGNNPKNWISNCKNYREVHYNNIWDGVDLIYYIAGESIKFKFQVNSVANIEKIKIKVEGAKVENNEIITEFGSITFSNVDCYTTKSRKKIDLGLSLSSNIISFEVDKDKFKQLKETIIIDSLSIPGEYFVTDNTANNQDKKLIYGRYVYSKLLGGSEDDIVCSMEVDKEECVYLTGYTHSSNFPTTEDAWDEKKSGPSDIFVSKLSSDGSSLIYSTYLGGIEGSMGCEEYEDEIAYSLAVDNEGCAYITGGTICSDFPITPGAISKRHNGNFDVFVTKLNSDGSRLLYSSFLGGESEDIGRSIALDEEKNIYIVGSTDSWNFPTTKGAFQENRKRTIYGASGFITKISPDGSKLIYSTFLGGSDINLCISLALDKEKYAYVTGLVTSSDFPTTENAYDKTMNGSNDIFISKLNSNGSALIYSTFLGGSEKEAGISIAVDEEGCAYITGSTDSSDFPTTENVWSRNLRGKNDIFITKINKDGSNLVYSSFLGGSYEEGASSIAVDRNGCVYITGGTMSPDFPVVESYTKFTGGGDAFILKMNPSGTDIIYSELIGGSELDSGRSIVIRDGKSSPIPGWTSISSTDIYIAGVTYSMKNKGWHDVFIRKICLEEFAAKKEKIVITLTIGNIEAFINQEKYILDAPPIIRDGRTLVPIRFIAEAFGAEVDWIPEDQEIIIYYEEVITIHLLIGEKRALITSLLDEGIKVIDLDTPPIIINGRTLVPIRFIAEAFGAEVDWIQEERKVIITHFRRIS